MSVPEDAELIDTAHKDSGAFGLWLGKDGKYYVAGYHWGPSGDVLFVIDPTAIRQQEKP